MTVQAERQQTEINREVADRMVWVKFQKEGIHCYPAAATEIGRAHV